MEGMMSLCKLCIVYTIKHFVSLSKVCMLQATVHRGNLATVHYNGVGAVEARHSVIVREFVYIKKEYVFWKSRHLQNSF